MGYCKSALSYVLRHGSMSNVMGASLENICNIPRALYELKDEPEIVTSETHVSEIQLTLTDELEQKLYKLVYTAVYQAVKLASSE